MRNAELGNVMGMPIADFGSRNGASGSSDMHGNPARVAESEAGAERMNVDSGNTVASRRFDRDHRDCDQLVGFLFDRR